MQVFVINLARSPERMARVGARLEALGVPFERVEAIDDAALTPEERRRSVSRFLWWCCSLRPIMKGQVGCTLSHQLVYRKMVRENLAHACVLEDDVVLDDRFPALLAWLEDRLDDARAQVTLLFDHTGGRMELARDAVPFACERIEESMFAEGYVLTRKAAEAILAANVPLRVMDDIWGRWVRQGRIELYRTRPAVCTQTSARDGGSTIDFVGFERRNLSLAGRLWWDLRRLVGIVVDACTGWPEFKGALALLGIAWRRAMGRKNLKAGE